MGGDRPTRGGVGNAPPVSARRLPGILGGGKGFERSVPYRERGDFRFGERDHHGADKRGPGTVRM